MTKIIKTKTKKMKNNKKCKTELRRTVLLQCNLIEE